jgi:hypothetical protein
VRNSENDKYERKQPLWERDQKVKRPIPSMWYLINWFSSSHKYMPAKFFPLDICPEITGEPLAWALMYYKSQHVVMRFKIQVVGIPYLFNFPLLTLLRLTIQLLKSQWQAI